MNIPVFSNEIDEINYLRNLTLHERQLYQFQFDMNKKLQKKN